MAHCEASLHERGVDPGEMDAVKFGKPEDWKRAKVKRNFGGKVK
jgi:hypothetical protein